MISFLSWVIKYKKLQDSIDYFYLWFSNKKAEEDSLFISFFEEYKKYIRRLSTTINWHFHKTKVDTFSD
jgi:hypothetical protein